MFHLKNLNMNGLTICHFSERTALLLIIVLLIFFSTKSQFFPFVQSSESVFFLLLFTPVNSIHLNCAILNEN